MTGQTLHKDHQCTMNNLCCGLQQNLLLPVLDLQESIGQQFRGRLELPVGTRLEYLSHVSGRSHHVAVQMSLMLTHSIATNAAL